MRPISRIFSFSRAVFLCAVFFLFWAALSSCGHKTPLSLEAFQPPQAPSNLMAVQRENVISLSWTYGGAEAVKDFIIEERIQKGISSGKGGPPENEKGREKEKTPFRMIAKVKGGSYSQPVIFGQTYDFRVMAESTSGVIGRPAEIVVPALAPPPQPQGLGFSIGNEFVTLKWRNIGKWDGKKVFYNIYQSAPGGKSKKSKTLLNASPITQNTFGVAPNTGQVTVYSVSAQLGGPFLYEGKSSQVIVKPADFVPAPPAAPTALKTAEGIRLIWNANPESWVSGYRIYRRIKTNGKWESAGFSSIPSYLDAGATSGDYRITAVGSVSESPFSVAIRIPPGK